jgi:hypothetical protein
MDKRESNKSCSYKSEQLFSLMVNGKAINTKYSFLKAYTSSSFKTHALLIIEF